MKRKQPKWRTKRDHFITRIMGHGSKAKVARGFDVRFPFSVAMPQKFFSLRHYGSLKRALAAAREYRDRVAREHDLPVHRAAKDRRSMSFFVAKRSDNTSGLIGVTLQVQDDGNSHWVAWYHPRPGLQRRRSWSVRRYTYDGARSLAVMWRNEMISKLRSKR